MGQRNGLPLVLSSKCPPADDPSVGYFEPSTCINVLPGVVRLLAVRRIRRVQYVKLSTRRLPSMTLVQSIRPGPRLRHPVTGDPEVSGGVKIGSGTMIECQRLSGSPEVTMLVADGGGRHQGCRPASRMLSGWWPGLHHSPDASDACCACHCDAYISSHLSPHPPSHSNSPP